MREVKTSLGDLMPLIEEKLASGSEVLFSPNGDSMLPTLKAGRDSLVLVSPPQRLKKYDVALYKRENGQYVIHRVISARGNYTFIGDAQLVYERGIKHEQIIALCVAYVRDGKRIGFDSFGARSHARRIHLARLLKVAFIALKRRLKSLFLK